MVELGSTALGFGSQRRSHSPPGLHRLRRERRRLRADSPPVRARRGRRSSRNASISARPRERIGASRDGLRRVTAAAARLDVRRRAASEGRRPPRCRARRPSLVASPWPSWQDVQPKRSNSSGRVGRPGMRARRAAARPSSRRRRRRGGTSCSGRRGCRSRGARSAGSRPAALDNSRAAFSAARPRDAPSSRILPLEGAVRPERVLGGRDREDDQEGDARERRRGGAAARRSPFRSAHRVHGQTNDQPGPRKKVPMTVRMVATIDEPRHDPLRQRHASRARGRTRPPLSPPRAANIARSDDERRDRRSASSGRRAKSATRRADDRGEEPRRCARAAAAQSGPAVRLIRA